MQHNVNAQALRHYILKVPTTANPYLKPMSRTRSRRVSPALWPYCFHNLESTVVVAQLQPRCALYRICRALWDEVLRTSAFKEATATRKTRHSNQRGSSSYTTLGWSAVHSACRSRIAKTDSTLVGLAQFQHFLEPSFEPPRPWTNTLPTAWMEGSFDERSAAVSIGMQSARLAMWPDPSDHALAACSEVKPLSLCIAKLETSMIHIIKPTGEYIATDEPISILHIRRRLPSKALLARTLLPYISCLAQTSIDSEFFLMAPSSTIVVNDGNHLDIFDKKLQAESLDSSKTSESRVFHRSLHSDPLHVVGAKGHYLTLSNGQEVFDASGGAAVACLGHGDVRIQDALMEQMSQVSYCHSLFYATHAAEDLAKLLIDSTNAEMARAFFISSGSEAMEAALKLARQYHLEKASPEPSRVHFISRHQSYHGTTLGALAAGGHVARRAIFEPILSINTSRVSPCYAYRAVHDLTEANETMYIRKLEAELDLEFQRVGSKNVAAFIAEPVVGAALGCVPPSPGYFKAVRRICDNHGALLIFDEVMSGTGRVGPEPSEKYRKPLHAWQDPLIGVVPDIMTMGKGLGGGYMPIAAMLANRRVVNALSHGTGAFSHGQTYQGHPLACRAALQVQRIIRDSDLVANVRGQGAFLSRLLHKRLENHPFVGNIRGRGLFWGIEFVKSKDTKEPFAPSVGIAMGIHELGMQRPYNISLYPGTGCADGKSGDHIILAPAYNITADEIRQVVDTTVTVIERFFSEMEAERDADSINGHN